MNIISKIRRMRTSFRLRSDDTVSLGEGTCFRDDFHWEVRGKTIQKPAIKTGSSCIVGGSFIIENDNAFITLGNESTVGSGSMLVAADSSIRIGNHAVISFQVTLYTTNAHSIDYKERRQDVQPAINFINGVTQDRGNRWNNIDSRDIVIEDDVWIGFGATILKGVTIGRGSIIGAKSVVTHDVEPFTVVAGNPARVVKKLIEH